jgi:hypothetical protein
VHGCGLIRCTGQDRYEIEDAFGGQHGIRHDLKAARALAANIKGPRPEPQRAESTEDAMPWIVPRDQRPMPNERMSPWRQRHELGPSRPAPKVVLQYANAKRFGPR